MSLNQLKDKIVNEIPISDLIQRYGTPLTRKSTGHVGICPFHNDTKPSMSVSNDKGIFKCFACGAGTSHFDFVMMHKNMSFIEALKDISETFGYDFDSYTNKREKSKKEIYAEKLLKVSSEIYFQTGMKARVKEYEDFLKNRDIPRELAETYKLGFAPKKNSITDYISTLPKNDQEEILKTAVEIGLVKWDDSRKSHYDTFRDRITFPIWDQFGKVIGFTSRAIHDYQKAKYMNSKESFIFNKRNLLYGLHLAKPFIRKRDEIILVEGNMDQLSMFKKGFENSVAIMGTALGDHSLRTIKSLTKNVYLALDTDQAGWDAGVRINAQFLSAGIIPKYISFEPVKDPDDFLKEKGSLAVKEKLENAKSFIDIQFEKMLPNEPITVLDKKIELLRASFSLIAPLKNDINATERLSVWAKKIGLESGNDQILQNYKDFLNGEQKNTPSKTNFENEAPPMMEEPPFDYGEVIESNAIPMPNGQFPEVLEQKSYKRMEKTLLQTVLEHPDCLEYDKLSELLDFMGPSEVKEYILELKNLIFEIDINEFKSFALKLAKNFDLEETVSKSLQKFSPSELDKDTAKKLIIDLEKKLIRESLKEKREELKRKRSTISTSEEMSKLMVEIHEIEKKLYSLSKE